MTYLDSAVTGTSRISTSKYLANFSSATWALALSGSQDMRFSTKAL